MPDDRDNWKANARVKQEHLDVISDAATDAAWAKFCILPIKNPTVVTLCLGCGREFTTTGIYSDLCSQCSIAQRNDESYGEY